jgi:hypothetical protein
LPGDGCAIDQHIANQRVGQQSQIDTADFGWARLRFGLRSGWRQDQYERQTGTGNDSETEGHGAHGTLLGYFRSVETTTTSEAIWPGSA